MTPKEFNRLCEEFGIPDSWLSKHVGGVSIRSWKYWRKGRPGADTQIPADVIDNMKTLNSYLRSAEKMKVIRAG